MPIKVKVYYINKDTTKQWREKITWNIKSSIFFLNNKLKTWFFKITEGANSAAFTYPGESYHFINACKRMEELGPSDY